MRCLIWNGCGDSRLYEDYMVLYTKRKKGNNEQHDTRVSTDTDMHTHRLPSCSRFHYEHRVQRTYTYTHRPSLTSVGDVGLDEEVQNQRGFSVE